MTKSRHKTKLTNLRKASSDHYCWLVTKVIEQWVGVLVLHKRSGGRYWA
jgi:hypothetical protein